jgi:hypothetical protein
MPGSMGGSHLGKQSRERDDQFGIGLSYIEKYRV